MEAITHKVPMIAFPHAFDQLRNAKVMVEMSLGLLMDIKAFSSEELVRNINEVLANQLYQQNVKHRSAILADQPMTSQETAAYWIEHVIKFSGAHLKSHALNMAWYEYYMVDILGLLVAVVCFSAIVIMLLFRYACSWVQNKVKQD